ncbi:hypothetical protein FBF83_08200 [Pseudalkalibacillus hwajinpoensis]|uniref:Uncharacterized protein n=1 Tax=Guptibacillus hwajinpoensis TaxID=208199 RepID=A0A4U1MJL8_9BACL|nr:hypothetical protein FBF83_08200 [Pseudalkalibacillus hwajinpoensis]
MLDSCGTSGTGETPQARLKRAEEAHRPHQGKRAPGAEITTADMTTMFLKTAISIDLFKNRSIDC